MQYGWLTSYHFKFRYYLTYDAKSLQKIIGIITNTKHDGLYDLATDLVNNETLKYYILNETFAIYDFARLLEFGIGKNNYLSATLIALERCLDNFSNTEILNKYFLFFIDSSEYSIVKMLIDLGVNITITDKHENTALHIACQNNDAKMVKILLDTNRFNPRQQNFTAASPLSITCSEFTKYYNSLKLLVSYCKKQDIKYIDEIKGASQFKRELNLRKTTGMVLP